MQLVTQRMHVNSRDLKASLLKFESIKTERNSSTRKLKRSDPSFIYVAQLVVDQIVMSTLS
jgi:hypothetical protein